MLRRGLLVQALARKIVHVRSGRLRTSISIGTRRETVSGFTVSVVSVGSNLSYAADVHNGTGIYGPRGVPIRPVRGKYLAFTGRRGRKVVVRSVKGQRGQRYLKRALRAARD